MLKLAGRPFYKRRIYYASTGFVIGVTTGSTIYVIGMVFARLDPFVIIFHMIHSGAADTAISSRKFIGMKIAAI